MSKQIVLITGASSGFGALTARALADAGGGAANTVSAGMRDTSGRNAPQAQAAKDYSASHGVDLRPVELDVNFQESVNAAVRQVLDAHGRIDVLIHNAGHMVTGPAEAFTPEQLAELYDVNVLSDEIARIVALPAGQRPYRVHIDPANDGSAEVSEVADRIRREFLTRIGLADLLTAAK